MKIEYYVYFGLDGSGNESWWGRDFLHPFRLVLEPPQPPVQRILSLFPGFKEAGARRSPPAPSSTEVIVELYLYFAVPRSMVNFELQFIALVNIYIYIYIYIYTHTHSLSYLLHGRTFLRS